MKVYLTPPQPSRGLQRIADALVKYKPEWVEVVSTQAEAELVVIYAIGRHDQLLQQVDYLLSANRKYAVIQVCLRSTQKPSTFAWRGIWDHAEVVWSYYDLQRAIEEDGDDNYWPNSHFYHAPLGVESDVFYPRNLDKRFIITTSGLSRLSESVRECWIAALMTDNEFMAHLGPTVMNGPICYDNITDNEVACTYSASHFVSGLRRKEGFEFPAAEGLLCGSRPIVFDTPDYRFSYRNWAEYIKETDRQGVVDQLVELFRRGARPVTQDEINEARQWFHWPTIVGGFYERLK